MLLLLLPLPINENEMAGNEIKENENKMRKFQENWKLIESVEC